MINLISIIPELLFFVILSFFLFTIPGFYLLGIKLNQIKDWKNYALGTTTGFVLFTLIAYILLTIHLNVLLLILYLLMNVLYLKKFLLHLPKLNQLSLTSVKKNKWLLLITLFFIIGVFGQLLIIAPSGSQINNNIVFWSAHGRDGVWHLALVNQLQRGFPFQNPDFATEKLVNYHFFSDIPIAQLNYFFKLPSIDLYFRFFPFLFSVLLGILSFQFGKLIGKNNQSGFWAMIFTFFAGSFGYFYAFLRDGSFGGEALFWSSQIQSVSGNPPQAIALVIILAFLILLVDFISQPNKSLGLVLILLAGTLAEFKIYGAVVLISSLLVVSLWYFLRTKKFSLLMVSVGSIILAAILYIPNTSSSESLLLFEPWWFIRTMVVATDKLDWLDLELRRQTYLAHHSYLRVAQLETEAFLIFLLGNLGMRVLGFWQLIKSGKSILSDYLSQMIFIMLLVSLILPMLFIQKAIPANTIQFFLYFLLLFGILAGVSTAQLLNKLHFKILRVVIGVLIIIIAVPTQIGLLQIFYQRPPFAQISQAEQEALTYLKDNSNQNETVLTQPFKKGVIFNGPTPPIWIWSDTSYVPAFSGRNAFVTDTEQLDIMGYDYKPRQEIQTQIFATVDPKIFEDLLKQNHINYLYFPVNQKPAVNITQTSLRNIYKNSEVEIWKLN